MVHTCLLKLVQFYFIQFADNSGQIGFSHGRSDSESGFDESGSQLSRSGFEETTCENNVSITHSPSTETLTDDFLDLEMKSVAVEWKSFRSVFTCSCAIPFDYYVKKVE